MMDTSLAWFELYDELRSRIKSGSLRAEGLLDRSAVGRDVDEAALNRALEQLVNEGLLQRGPSKTLTVARPRARSRRSASFQDDYASQGRQPSIETISLELMPFGDAPEFVRQAFAGANCHMLVRHHHVQSVDRIPHAICDSFYPYELVCSHWTAIKAGGIDIYAALKNLGYDITEKQETLYVDSPTLPEREHLGMAKMPSVSVVRLDCIVWSGTQVIEACVLCDRADLYEFTYRVRT